MSKLILLNRQKLWDTVKKNGNYSFHFFMHLRLDNAEAATIVKLCDATGADG